MNEAFWLLAASRILGLLFFVLLAWGMAARFRHRRPFLAFRRRQVQALAAGRFARGEIDEATYRQLRTDLRDLA